MLARPRIATSGPPRPRPRRGVRGSPRNIFAERAAGPHRMRYLAERAVEHEGAATEAQRWRRQG